MRRTQIKRTGKKAAEWAQFVRTHPVEGACEACGKLPAVCWHHRGQRSTHPKHATNPANVIGVCEACHRLIHAEIEAAEKVGLLLPSWVEPGSEDDPWGRGD